MTTSFEASTTALSASSLALIVAISLTLSHPAMTMYYYCNLSDVLREQRFFGSPDSIP